MSGPTFVKYDANPVLYTAFATGILSWEMASQGNRWLVFKEDGSLDGEAIASFKFEEDSDPLGLPSIY